MTTVHSCVLFGATKDEAEVWIRADQAKREDHKRNYLTLGKVFRGELAKVSGPELVQTEQFRAERKKISAAFDLMSGTLTTRWAKVCALAPPPM